MAPPHQPESDSASLVVAGTSSSSAPQPEPKSTSSVATDTDRRALCDVRLLFAARTLRLFAFGGVNVTLLLLLPALGVRGASVGLLLTLVLLGDLVITLRLVTAADRLGRRRTLCVGSALALLSAVVFGSGTTSYTLLALAGIIGVVSPAGGDIGPFLAVEQAALADISGGEGVAAIARTYGRYQCAGDLAKAAGSATMGWAVAAAISSGVTPAVALRLPMLAFGGASIAKAALYLRLSEAVEARPQPAADGMTPQAEHAGGFTMLPFLSFYFRGRWGLELSELGLLLSLVSIVAGLSGMASGWLVKRYGALEVMVFTHLPSNLLLLLVPLAPSRQAALLVLVMRFTISQMDVPARQAYVASLVASDERSSAGGITNLARSVGLLLSPLLLGVCMSAEPTSAAFDAPFWISGGLKVVYDVTVWVHFSSLRRRQPAAGSTST